MNWLNQVTLVIFTYVKFVVVENRFKLFVEIIISDFTLFVIHNMIYKYLKYCIFLIVDNQHLIMWLNALLYYTFQVTK